MKLGVLTVPLQNIPAEEAFAYLSSLGVQTLELGTGGYTCACHLDPDACLADESKITEVQNLLEKIPSGDRRPVLPRQPRASG